MLSAKRHVRSHSSSLSKRIAGSRAQIVGLSALGLSLAVWLILRRRRHRIGRTLDQLTDDARDLDHSLCTIQGYCELAKLKGESGAALERRMDAVIETVAETSALVRRLVPHWRRSRL